MSGLILFFSRSGTSKWLLQRFAAMIVLSYIIFLACIFITHREMDYSEWLNLNKSLSFFLWKININGTTQIK